MQQTPPPALLLSLKCSGGGGGGYVKDPGRVTARGEAFADVLLLYKTNDKGDA